MRLRPPLLRLAVLWTVPCLVAPLLTLASGGLPDGVTPLRFALAQPVLWWFWIPVSLWVWRRAARWQEGPPRRVTGPLLAELAQGVVCSLVYCAWIAAVAAFERAQPILADLGPRTVDTINRAGLGVLFLYGLLTAIAIAVRAAAFGRERQAAARALELRLADARLAALHARLQPHFLFNALNTVAAAVRGGDRALATGLLARLSDVLRDVLDGSGGARRSLAAECALGRRYLEIEQARYGADRLTVDMEIAPELVDQMVPCLAVQPLLENAIKHGVARSAEPVHLQVRAVREDQDLLFSVVNSGPEVESGAFRHRGDGLGNLSERLALMYGGRGHLEARPQNGGGARVTLRIPLSQATEER